MTSYGPESHLSPFVSPKENITQKGASGEEAGTPPSASASGLALRSELSHPSLHGLQLLLEDRGALIEPRLLFLLRCKPSRPGTVIPPTWRRPPTRPASKTTTWSPSTTPSEGALPPTGAPAPTTRPWRSRGPVRGVSVTPSSSSSSARSHPHGTRSIKTWHLSHLLSHRLRRLPSPDGAFDASPPQGSIPCQGRDDPPDTRPGPPLGCR